MVETTEPRTPEGGRLCHPPRADAQPSIIGNGVAVKFMKILLSVILTFAASWALWEIQRDRIEMDYEVIESAPFPRTDGVGKYYIVRLRNAGNRSIENIDLRVDFNLALWKARL